MSIQDLVDDFEFLGEWEDRYRYVIELGKELEPLSEEEHSAANKVEGCVSQVWLVNELRKADDGAPLLHFRGDSDAHIVRGLIAILMRLYSDKRPAEILGLDARAVFDIDAVHLFASRARLMCDQCTAQHFFVFISGFFH